MKDTLATVPVGSFKDGKKERTAPVFADEAGSSRALW